MKQSSKCAIGGIVAAVSLVLMISVAIIPFLTYALPAVAGLFIVFIVIEIDKKNANLAKHSYTTEDGEIRTRHELWVSAWKDLGEFVDNSLDEYF